KDKTASEGAMSQSDLTRFRRMCGQFRWLAVFMVGSIGAAMLLIFVGAPLLMWLRDGQMPSRAPYLATLIWFAPAAFYLFGVWSIGSAMGQLARGRLIQPTLSSALRRVGLALGVGGLLTVFGVSNLFRLVGFGHGGVLNFDIGGMTL